MNCDGRRNHEMRNVLARYREPRRAKQLLHDPLLAGLGSAPTAALSEVNPGQASVVAATEKVDRIEPLSGIKRLEELCGSRDCVLHAQRR